MKKSPRKWIAIFVFLLVSGYLMYQILGLVMQINESKKQKEKIENQIKIEEQINKELENEKELIESKDETYMEKKAREELGMIKEGEIVFEDRNKD